MGNPSLERLHHIASNMGACNTQVAQQYVSANAPFTVIDVAAIQDAYFDGRGETAVRLSDLPGKICWKSLGEMENRKMVDRLAANCKTVLSGEGAAEKCEAISDVIHQMPISEPDILSVEGLKHYSKEGLKWLGGAIGVWAIFGPGLHYFNQWVNRKGPPSGPSAGAGPGNAAAPSTNAPAQSPEKPAAPAAEARVSTAYRNYWRLKDSGHVESDAAGNALIALPLGLFAIARSGVVLTVEAVEQPFKFAADKLIYGAMKLAL